MRTAAYNHSKLHNFLEPRPISTARQEWPRKGYDSSKVCVEILIFPNRSISIRICSIQSNISFLDSIASSNLRFQFFFKFRNVASLPLFLSHSLYASNQLSKLEIVDDVAITIENNLNVIFEHRILKLPRVRTRNHFYTPCPQRAVRQTSLDRNDSSTAWHPCVHFCVIATQWI